MKEELPLTKIISILDLQKLIKVDMLLCVLSLCVAHRLNLAVTDSMKKKGTTEKIQ